jgi:hypothetical protein
MKICVASILRIWANEFNQFKHFLALELKESSAPLETTCELFLKINKLV